ncbi:MAG: peptidyl-tRNA hydrolase Pth2 [Candidatus Woesearchaeota archaeon]|jgi:PTH2 family peptidyl-tRNA hydrolase|nr:peptidyl-tRNA hydrolase Pth2 [Candidatus Woesearchaeota archaeon]|tara:strand:- start:60 stop:404 length:345 start_codon:yes stop_codon:yes gene_type:complete
MPYKQVILVRKDLKLPEGKLAAQVAHASIASTHNSKQTILKKWMQEGMKKIVLSVADEEQLKLYEKKAKDAKLVAEIITDAGHTIVDPGTITCLGIGPDEENKIDKVTGNLKIL